MTLGLNKASHCNSASAADSYNQFSSNQTSVFQSRPCWSLSRVELVPALPASWPSALLLCTPSVSPPAVPWFPRLLLNHTSITKDTVRQQRQRAPKNTGNFLVIEHPILLATIKLVRPSQPKSCSCGKMKSHFKNLSLLPWNPTISLLLLLLLLSRFFSRLLYCLLWWWGIAGGRYGGGRVPFIAAGGDDVRYWHWRLIWRTGFGRSGWRRRFRGSRLWCNSRCSSGDRRRDLCLVHCSTFFHSSQHGLESLWSQDL